MAKKSQPSGNNTLLFLSALTFILASTTSLAMYKRSERPKPIYIADKKVNLIPHIAPLPVLAAETDSTQPVFSAISIIALDVDSGVTLFEKNPDEVLYPASTTKIVTALVALDIYRLTDVVTINNPPVDGQKMGLMNGEQITVENLLKGMLIFSANDAAEALARNYPGGYEDFIALMNAKAQSIAMTNSHFMNASGLENWQHVSTARDMSRAAAAAMNNPLFSEIVGTKKTTVTSVDGTHVHKLANVNKLIGTVEGVIGVKTGYTEHAKENLITYVKRNGKRVVISLLGSDDRFGETTTLIDWVYGNYKWEEVVLP
jgi:serine-type D-Ala-D-Ala carboxypeptidase (penicillin-binding protein 5/6)